MVVIGISLEEQSYVGVANAQNVIENGKSDLPLTLNIVNSFL